MRLLTLTFTGIGPFAGTETIDFSRFDASGLFLLRGRTGSGKSTIIDALCYALYGSDAVGVTSNVQRLRSRYAEPTAPSSVTLRFDVNGGVYEVSRTVPYLKPGNASETPAKASIERLVIVDGTITERIPLATRIREVNATVVSIVGLAYAQFLQTVVLPQGKFAQFIEASPMQRTTVLRDIFKTGDFEAFQRTLKERADQARRHDAEARTALLAHVVQLSEDARELTDIDSADGFGDRMNALIGAGDFDAMREELTDILAAGTVTLDTARSSAARCAADYADARSDLHNADAIADAREQFTRAQREAAEAQAAWDALEPLRERSRLGEAARLFAAPIHATDSAARALNAAEDDARRAREGVSEATITAVTQRELDTATLDDVPLASLRNAITQVQRELGGLDHAVDLEHRVEDAQQERDAAQETLADAQQRAQALSEAVAAAQMPLATYAEQLAHYREQLDGIDECMRALTTAAQELEQARTADKHRRDLVDIAEEIGQLRRDEQQSARQHRDLVQRWIQSQASLIADTLSDDQPCPVCGSLTHPDPAEPNNDQVTWEAVDTAHQHHAALAEKLTTAQTTQAELTKAIAAIVADLGGRATEAIEEHHRACDERYRELTAIRDQLPTWQREYDEACGALDAQRRELDDTTRTIETAEARRAEAEQRMSQLADAYREACCGYDSVEARRVALVARDEELRAVVAAVEACDRARERDGEARAALATMIDDSAVFASVDEVREALVSDDELRSMTERIDTARAAVHEARGRVEAARDNRWHSHNGLDRDHLRHVVASLAARSDHARDDEQRCEQTMRILRRRLTTITKASKAIETEMTDMGSLLTLARIANAQGTSAGATTLETWVLRTRFEDVLAAANPYLAAFSSGKYELRFTEKDATSQAVKSGLGLSIFANDEDGERGPHTLSGGERFYTSLALALGLAEVVSSEAGGVEFKTMLIDEGFGHLDGETLDQVMRGLESLRSTGRTIGVISHVEEMRRRIHDGIEVSGQVDGPSTLRIHA